MIVFGGYDGQGGDRGDTWSLNMTSAVAVPGDAGSRSHGLALAPTRPNPARDETIVGFGVEVPSRVVIEVFNARGRIVGFLNLGVIQLKKRDIPAARGSFSRVAELSGMGDYFRPLTTAIVEFTAGNEPASRAAMREFERRFGAGDPSTMAGIHAWRGEADAAFAALDRAMAARDPALGAVQTNILLQPLHDDPRWKDLLRKIGLPTR